jgi:Rrf2 family protein
VISHRGNTGGFELEERHRAVTLLQVVEAVEGPIRLNLCLMSDHGCNRQRWCPAHSVWTEAQQAMLAVLNSATVGDLAKTAQRQLHEELALIDGIPWN